MKYVNQLKFQIIFYSIMFFLKFKTIIFILKLLIFPLYRFLFFKEFICDIS